MIDLKDRDQVIALQSNLRALFDGAPGKEVMGWFEQVCGWYDFQEMERDMILMGHGKRQFLATLKTLLKLSADDVVLLANKEG